MNEANEKRNILLGISGSIAAYKAAELARLYVSRGYHVRVIMTGAGQEFVTPLTFESVTGHPVISDFWSNGARDGIEHIQLADWADVVVVAPATADILAKLVMGAADNPLLATILATRVPILVAPAMNVNMYEHPVTQKNLETLKERSVQVVAPESGALACGWNGSGRLASPWEIFYQTQRALSAHDFEGKHVVISTGPTREAIDPVRFISNRSSGKMGVALAREAYRRGAKVTLVHGPVSVRVPTEIECVPVFSAMEMQAAMLKATFEVEDIKADFVIMASAVADYRPVEVYSEKIKKEAGLPPINLVENPDILGALGARRAGNPYPKLIGFAVETGEIEDLLDEVRAKLERKNADLIIGNMADDAFDKDTNRVWLVDRSGRTDEVMMTYKSRVAIKIFDSIRRLS